jgi:hypothetical protein
MNLLGGKMKAILSALFVLALTGCRTTSPSSEAKQVVTNVAVEGLVAVENGPGYSKIYITTYDAQRLLLRGDGENAFELPVTRTYLGQLVNCTGKLVNNMIFIYDVCTVLALPQGEAVIAGVVTLDDFGGASHSASQRVFVQSADGNRYQIRKHDENAFELPYSRALVGYPVMCVGPYLQQQNMLIYRVCAVSN